MLLILHENVIRVQEEYSQPSLGQYSVLVLCPVHCSKINTILECHELSCYSVTAFDSLGIIDGTFLFYQGYPHCSISSIVRLRGKDKKTDWICLGRTRK